jgi:transcription elongation GreA/GreB family factor
VSRAFVKESHDESVPFPDRPISPHRNFVTARGMAAIEANFNRFEAAHRSAVAKDNKEAAASALREVRYWSARRSTAEVVKPPSAPDRVAFATTFTLRRDDGREQTFTIVGEDEADPASGTISYVSPLAKAAIGHAVGDSIDLSSQTAVILNIISSSNDLEGGPLEPNDE